MNKTDNYIFAFATFGHPNDFRQTAFLGSDPEVARNIKVFDLSNAIKVFPDSTIYSLRKEIVGTNQLIAYSIYTFAQEQASKRDGTFIGSSIVLANQLSDENLIISSLNEFHNKLKNNNLHDSILKVNHSKDFVAGKKLEDFDKIEILNREIQDLNFTITGKSLVVYCETKPDKLQLFFKNGIDLLNIYDTIYFTQSQEVANFVKQKGLFKLIQNVEEIKDFENEIQLLLDKRKQEIQSYLQELEKSNTKLENDRKSNEEKFRKQIEQNEAKQKENEKLIQESKTELNNVNIKYSEFSKKITELILKLKNNEKIEIVKELYAKNLKNFEQSIREKKELRLISSIKNPEVIINSRGENHYNPDNQNPTTGNGLQNKNKEYKLDIFKVLTLVFGITIIGLLTYFFVFYKKEINQSTEPVVDSEPIAKQDTLQNTIKLNPIPNSEVKPEIVNKMNSKLVKNSKIDSVTNFILKSNPSSISDYYKYQKSDYKKILFEKNINSFKIENQDTIYINYLTSIPNFMN